MLGWSSGSWRERCLCFAAELLAWRWTVDGVLELANGRRGHLLVSLQSASVVDWYQKAVAGNEWQRMERM